MQYHGVARRGVVWYGVVARKERTTIARGSARQSAELYLLIGRTPAILMA